MQETPSKDLPQQPGKDIKSSKTDRRTEGQTDRQTQQKPDIIIRRFERQLERRANARKASLPYINSSDINLKTDKPTDRQTHKHTNRQTDGQTDRETDREILLTTYPKIP